MNDKLLELKNTIAELHNILLEMSARMWDMNSQIDELILAENDLPTHPDMEILDEDYDDGGPIAMSHSDQVAKTEPEMLLIKAKRKPRSDMPPNPPESPVVPPQPPTIPNIPPISPEPPKPTIVERLLGKDTAEKQRQRAEKMAQLERELADLKAK